MIDIDSIVDDESARQAVREWQMQRKPGTWRDWTAEAADHTTGRGCLVTLITEVTTMHKIVGVAESYQEAVRKALEATGEGKR